VRRWRVLLALAVCFSSVSVAPAAAGGPEDFETLVASDALGGDWFGFSMALDGNRLVIGTPYDRLPVYRLGSVWVFTRHGLGWEAEKITPDEFWKKGGYGGGRGFGFDVDIAGDRIVVGAPGAWVNGVETGGVFLYDYIDGEWVETILEPDGVDDCDGIGYQVDLSDDGNRILIGSYKSAPGYFRPGKAFLYELIDGEWVSHMFEPSDGKSSDRFGSTVGFGDGFIAIGSPNHGAAGNNAGAMYIYEQVDGEWVETKVVSDYPDAGDHFGIYIEVYGETIVVRIDDQDSLILMGRSGDGWGQELLDLNDPGPAGTEETDGSGLPVVGAKLFAGDYGDKHPQRAPGALRVMERTVDEWVEVDRFEGTEFGVGNGFGHTLIIREGLLIIGAPWFKLNGETSGLVFVQGMPAACGTWEPTIVGTNGDDEIWGTGGDDVIVPGSGADVIHVSGGRDVYCLNDGNYWFTSQVAFTRSGTEGHEILVTAWVRPEWQMLIAN